MPHIPRLTYYLDGENAPVNPNEEIWSAPLPTSRGASPRESRKGDDRPATHGDFFTAARDFLESNNYETIRAACTQCLGKEVSPGVIREIRVFLVKHGEFYHPARIEPLLSSPNDPPPRFVLNAAISEIGKKTLSAEYAHLTRLNEEFPFDHLPRVFHHGQGRARDHGAIPMFLGQWLDGFHEFHISRNPSAGAPGVTVWDGRPDAVFLTDRQTVDLYRKTALILTSYFNMETFERIFPWHHAAGDFVVRPHPDGVDLRLITVRGYGPMLSAENGNGAGERDRGPDPARVLGALLLFFLSLSIRTRVDRLDGVGETVWADDAAVYGALAGFFEGMGVISRIHGAPDDFPTYVHAFFASHSDAELYDLSQGLVKTQHTLPEEAAVIRPRLKRHVDLLCAALRDMECSTGLNLDRREGMESRRPDAD